MRLLRPQREAKTSCSWSMIQASHQTPLKFSTAMTRRVGFGFMGTPWFGKKEYPRRVYSLRDGPT